MEESKMHLINKIFNNETIRTIWSKEEEKYYISVVDIVRILTNSDNPRKYWNKLKQRLKEVGNETVTKCHQLKLKAQDGKYRMTDVVDIEGMFRIIESIPSKNAEPIKMWLAGLGKERINEIYKEWSGMTASEYKEYKWLRKESLRDNMDNLEVILADLSEETTKRLAEKHKPRGLEENKLVAKMGGHSAKVARDDIEKNLGEQVITQNNHLNYEYTTNNQIETK